jgi:hypothetical protein
MITILNPQTQKALDREVVSFMPHPLYPQGKSPWYLLDRRLVGPRASLDAEE